MATEYVVRPWERALFLRCRRAWDFGAHERQGLEPGEAPEPVDLDRAVKDAMAVFYFPGMWEWNRAIVAPLATEAFNKAMRDQRLAHETAIGVPLSSADSGPWEAASAAGRLLLSAYYEWAAAVDAWSPVQVETLFDVTVPEPGEPESGLLSADGRGVLYRLRVDLVVMDRAGRYWVVEHRLRHDGFAEMDELLLDDAALTRSWGWEQGFLSQVAGTIHNELRVPPAGGRQDRATPGGPDDVEVVDLGSRRVHRWSGPWFRRTRIRRTRAEIAGAGRAVADQARLMTRAGIDCYPNPTPDTCRPCEFRPPCLAVTRAADPEPVLREFYRPRLRRDFEEGRLGSVWGFVPHRSDHTHVRLNPPERPGPG